MRKPRRNRRTQLRNPFRPKPGKRRKFSDGDNETFPNLQRSRSESNSDEVFYEKYLEGKRSLQDVRSCATKETANNLKNQLEYQEGHGQKRKLSEANSGEFETFDYKSKAIRRPKSKPCGDQKGSMQPISTKTTRCGRKRRVSSVHTGFLRKIHEEYYEPPSRKMRLMFPNATISEAPRPSLSTHWDEDKSNQQGGHTKQFTPMMLEKSDSFASIPELKKFKCLSISSSTRLLGAQILFVNQGYRTSCEPSIIPSVQEVSADPSTDVAQ